MFILPHICTLLRPLSSLEILVIKACTYIDNTEQNYQRRKMKFNLFVLFVPMLNYFTIAGKQKYYEDPQNFNKITGHADYTNSLWFLVATVYVSTIFVLMIKTKYRRIEVRWCRFFLSFVRKSFYILNFIIAFIIITTILY
jgi:hypothetical protein